MLMQVGSVQFEVYPVNIHKTSVTDSAGIVEKPVLGRRPPLEFVGQATGKLTLDGKLFPQRFGGSIDDLYRQMAAGKAYPVMRGDGVSLGWYAISSVRETASYLDRHGRGRVVEFTVDLTKSDKPGVSSLFSIIAGLFS